MFYNCRLKINIVKSNMRFCSMAVWLDFEMSECERLSTNRNDGGGYPRAEQIRSTGVLVGTWMLEAVCSILGAEFPSGSAENRQISLLDASPH